MFIEKLAEYCEKFDSYAMPPEVVEAAKLKVLDAIGCALAAGNTETARIFKRYAETYAGRGDVPIWGGGTASATEAAYVNGVLAHALLHDDTDLESGHPECMIVPAALAATKPHGSGINLLAGIALGYEIMWRASGCGDVVTGSLGRGFRGYVVNGMLGAAVSAGKVLELSKDGYVAALSCAANVVCGLLESVGLATVERAIMAGVNARSGLQGAMLGKCGVVGTPSIFEGPQGYFRAVGGLINVDTERLLRGLGGKHRILESLYKRYPSAGANQSAIYAAEIFQKRHRPNPELVRSVTVWQYPLFGEAVPVDDGKPAYPSIVSTGPYENVEQTLPNKPFSVASMLLNGVYDSRTIVSGLNNERVRDLAKKVKSHGRDSYGPMDAAIEVVMSDGQKIIEVVSCNDDPRFFPKLGDMQSRLEAMCGKSVGSREIARLVEAVSLLDKEDGLSRLDKVLRTVTISESGKDGQ